MLLFCTILLAMGSAPNLVEAGQTGAPPESSYLVLPSPPLRFTGSTHVVGFLPQRVYMTSLDSTLSVEFLGARRVEPQANNEPTYSTVVYRELWNGIDVVYEQADNAIAKSLYRVAPYADVSQIQLRYSLPVDWQPDGSLRMSAQNSSGYLAESAPLAWQQVEGARVPVSVSFDVENGVIRFETARYDPRYPLVIDPTYAWHTFYGPNDEQSDLFANAVAVAADGSVYIAGTAWNWQGDGVSPPMHPYTGKNDICVLKLDSNGVYQWRTFYGSAEYEHSKGIVIDSDGNIYVTGESNAGWLGDGGAKPLHEYSSNPHSNSADLFVLKLDPGGAYKWHTFYGSSDSDFGTGIAAYGNDVYVLGFSASTWLGDGDTPPLNVGRYTTVLKLSANGVYQWHAFYASGEGKIVVSEYGSVYVAATAAADWSNYTNTEPIHSYSGREDISVFKLTSDGAIQWHTFFGSNLEDYVAGVAVDENENVYVSGTSVGAWLGEGNTPPLHSHTGKQDMTVLKLAYDGAYLWHTFYGSAEDDESQSMAVDPENNVYILGESDNAWRGDGNREPLHGWTDQLDIAVLGLTELGTYRWHTFYGGADRDQAGGIALQNNQGLYFAATSLNSWLGDDNTPPLHAFNTGYTTAVLKLEFPSSTPSLPLPLKPANKALVGKLRPTLDWTDVPARLNYRIQLYKNKRNGNLVADTLVVSSKFKSPALIRGKKYVWRVQACNELGCSNWSPWWKFEVKVK